MKNQKIYSIYKIINLINGKLYIGCTTEPIFCRLKRHVEFLKKNPNTHYIFHRAMKKHGIKNFTIELIEETDSKEKMFELEKFYIKKYNTFYKNGKGYNMTLGGEGTCGHQWTTWQKKRASNIQKQSFINNPQRLEKMKNYRASDKTKEKQSLAKLGKPALYKRKSFIIISPENKIIKGNGLKQFSQIHNLLYSELSKVIKGKKKHHKNWIAYQEKFNDPKEILKFRQEILKEYEENGHQKRNFKLISPDGILYKEKGIAEFCKKHHLKRPNIIAVLNGRRKSCNGWHLP